MLKKSLWNKALLHTSPIQNYVVNLSLNPTVISFLWLQFVVLISCTVLFVQCFC